MQQQSGVAPGGDGRVRAAFGDRVIGVNIISNMNGVGGSGGGDIAMATGASFLFYRWACSSPTDRLLK